MLTKKFSSVKHCVFLIMQTNCSSQNGRDPAANLPSLMKQMVATYQKISCITKYTPTKSLFENNAEIKILSVTSL